MFKNNMINRICNLIADNGGRAFIVGGYVRDKILGKESKDIDIEVYGISIDKLYALLSLLGDVKEVGRSFGVFKVGDIDVSLPRTESKSGAGHRGFDVNSNSNLDYKEACRRRDLTMNALMLDPLTGEILDFFGGVKDVKAKVIRHVDDETFGDDPLRLLRVAQFAARFGFDVHMDTVAICSTMLAELETLPKERIFTEIVKILILGAVPSSGFQFLLISGSLEILLPEIFALIGIEQGPKYHPEGNVFNHTMLALDSVPLNKRNTIVMLAILLHDVGKVVVEAEQKEADHIAFKGHETAGGIVGYTLLDRITEDKTLKDAVVNLVTHHMQPYQLKKNMKKKTVRRLATKVDIPMLLEIHKADKLGRGVDVDLGYVNDIIAVYEEIESEIKPLIMGRHLIELGATPSPEFGKILKSLFELQLDGFFNTVEHGRAFAKSLLFDPPDICSQGEE